MLSQSDNAIRLFAGIENHANDTVGIDYLKSNNCVILKSEIVSSKEVKKNTLNSIIIQNIEGFDINKCEIYKISLTSTKCLDGVTIKHADSNCFNEQLSRFIVSQNKLFVKVFVRRNSREIKKPLEFYLYIN